MVHAKNEPKNHTVWINHANGWVWQRNFRRDYSSYKKGRVEFWFFGNKGDLDLEANSVDAEETRATGKVGGIVITKQN